MNKHVFDNAAVILATLFAWTLSGSAIADGPHMPKVPLSAADRQAVMQTLDAKLRANYVFPDVAERVIKSLDEKNGKGDYSSAQDMETFSDLLSKDLRTFSSDLHFRVRYEPQFHEDSTPDAVPSAEDVEKQRAEVLELGFGIQRVERLPGNVGYMELRGFGPTAFVAPAYTSALTLLSGTDALILDLRRNGGGEPSSVQYLMSHFFAIGDERHLNDIYTRPTNVTQQYWTQSSVGVRYLKPVYVLTSPRTFSGGEECAYDFQTQKRATLVGEATGGGANPVDSFSVGHGLVVAIPTGRAINPLTHTNWEHVGVKPDVSAPAAQAQQVAYLAILRSLLAKSDDPERTEDLQRILARVEKGEAEQPVYTMRH
ncbi:MAG TPA: S41 family peptidase [Burkholderiaceae bacterium]